MMMMMMMVLSQNVNVSFKLLPIELQLVIKTPFKFLQVVTASEKNYVVRKEVDMTYVTLHLLLFDVC